MRIFCKILPAAGVLLVSAALATIGTAAAQEKALDSEVKIGEFDLAINTNSFFELMEGRRQATKTDEKLLNLAARYFVYGTTIKALQGPELQYKKRKQFASYIGIIKSNSAKNEKFRTKFTQELIACFGKVFALKQNGNEVALTNAGLLLPIFAELGEPELAYFCAKLVKDKKPLIVQLFAFKAFATHFEANPPRLKKFALNPQREKLAQLLDPIVDFVKTPPANVEKMSAEEIDGYRFVRCEAIKALARTKLPWVPLLPGVGKIKPPKYHAPVAYVLMQALAEGQSGLTPPASLSEQVEAVKGLCAISANVSYVGDQPPYYNPEPAVKLIGRGLVRYAQVYTKDREIFKAKDNKLPTLHFWKLTSLRLEKVLQQFPGKLPAGSKAQKSAQKMTKEALAMFEQMKGHRSVDNVVALQTTYQALKVNPTVYRGFPVKIMAK